MPYNKLQIPKSMTHWPVQQHFSWPWISGWLLLTYNLQFRSAFSHGADPTSFSLSSNP